MPHDSPPTSASPIQAGRADTLGAHVRDGGVNFAVFSQNAVRVELCVFDADGARELGRHPLCGPEDGVFHCFLADARPGMVYGFRAYGPHCPDSGHRFNPHKLLLDPYAREIVGHFAWRPEHHGYTLGHPDGLRALDMRDNAATALKARVASPSLPTPRPARPRHRPADLVLYEVHVKGFSKLMPDIPPELRGTYAGLGHPAAIAWFRSLGVTTLSLLPVQYGVDEVHLAERGLVNYWGYNTLGFFCPDPRLATRRDHPGAVTREFRDMVDALHAAGLEVVLDVVYNHTPEGNEFGPTLSFRGLDHASWYRLDPDDRSRCENLTGCGNTLNVAHPRVTQFVLDSLRYWVQDMGVDGFRFDLAPVLGRGDHGFDAHAPFFTALRQDPVLAGVHLIAEPWDAGPQGYQLGRFPGRFMEWNDKFRDAVRGYWLQRGVGRGDLARRFCASSDVFHHGQRLPHASVNFLSVHDGFTLADTVSYSRKHNRANGEDNRDGRDDELCANFGCEGASDDPGVVARRARVRRAMMATLLLAQGTPMLCAGDEIGNSQQGNNNAYCQDNPTGWLDWPAADLGFRDFVAGLLEVRRREPLLRHDRWFNTSAQGPDDARVRWFAPDGGEMTTHDWHDGGAAAFACEIASLRADLPEGSAVRRWRILFNGAAQAQDFALDAGDWRRVLDSSGESPANSPVAARVVAPAHSLLLLASSH